MKLYINLRSINIFILVFIILIIIFILNFSISTNDIVEMLIFIIVEIVLYFVLKNKYFVLKNKKFVKGQVKKVLEPLFIPYIESKNHIFIEKYNFKVSFNQISFVTLVCFYFTRKPNLDKKKYLKNTIFKYINSMN